MAKMSALGDDLPTSPVAGRDSLDIRSKLLGPRSPSTAKSDDVEVNAAIDNLQTVLAVGWTRQVQAWSCVVSAGLGLVLLLLLDAGAAAKFTSLLATLVIGGYFAWLARDLAALLERKQ
jgi:hypothetical protein